MKSKTKLGSWLTESDEQAGVLKDFYKQMVIVRTTKLEIMLCKEFIHARLGDQKRGQVTQDQHTSWMSDLGKINAPCPHLSAVLWEPLIHRLKSGQMLTQALAANSSSAAAGEGS